MSSIVWDAENGWHDGPPATVSVDSGRIIATPKTPQGTLWVCSCCLLAREAEGCRGQDHEHETEPWSDVSTGCEVTYGLMADQHFDGAGCQDDDECGCERKDFTWRACDACGSPLGGTRHAYTWWGE